MRILLFIVAMMIAMPSQARDQIRIVGSSTVFPFVAAVAERYSDNTGHKAPIVESIGTGAGMLEFCKGVGTDYPDIVNASRPMLGSEKEICDANNVGEVIEVPIGMDGIVIASGIEGDIFPLTRRDLFMALAKDVPVDGKLTTNPYTRWKQVNAALPDKKIEVYGPKSTSGTRDAFVEMVMESACMDLPEFVAEYQEKKTRKTACHTMREDGHYIEAGENDNLIVQKLALNPDALGIFGYSYLDQNMDKIAAHTVDGIDAEFEHIADGSYPVARTLYVYVKKAHIDAIAGMKPFLEELISEEALSDEGYLTYKGLIPYMLEKRQAVRGRISAL